jgi:parallel beta-helix repeat protein
MNQCIRQGYVNGTCRGYVVYPGESICESNEVNIGQTEGCYVEEGRMGVGRTCCCGTNRIITQLTVAKDGSGNFTDIQQAIDYARELWGGTQKTIKIKSGTYIVNRYTKYPFVGYPFVGLVLPSNTIFQGEPGVIIKEVDGGIMERLITNEHSCTYNQTANKCQYMKSNLKDNNIIIKDLVIDGNGANQPYPYNSSRHCIWFLNVKDVTLDNVIVKNCAGIGIVTTWYSDIVVDKVSVSNCNGNGIYIDRGLNFFLDESIFENNSYSGIDIYLSNNVTVESCRVVESFAGSGINMDSVINSKISNCIINHNAEPGIWLWAEGGPWRPDHPEGGSETSNNVITGCTISNNGWRSQATGLPGQFDGIDFSHDSTYENTANHNTVNNNRIYDDQPQHTQRYAIGIAHPTDDYNFIADNYYWGNIKDSEGIVGFIRGVANHTTIEGNINHSP